MVGKLLATLAIVAVLAGAFGFVPMIPALAVGLVAVAVAILA